MRRRESEACEVYKIDGLRRLHGECRLAARILKMPLVPVSADSLALRVSRRLENAMHADRVS